MNAGDRDWGDHRCVAALAGCECYLLAPQDGLYTVSERGPAAHAPRLIGAVRRVLHSDNRKTLAPWWSALASPDVHIVTLTVTEKGYVPRGDGFRLDYLGKALMQRRGWQGWPATRLISCDNLPGNGERLAAALSEYLDASDAETARWLRPRMRLSFKHGRSHRAADD